MAWTVRNKVLTGIFAAVLVAGIVFASVYLVRDDSSSGGSEATTESSVLGANMLLRVNGSASELDNDGMSDEIGLALGITAIVLPDSFVLNADDSMNVTVRLSSRNTLAFSDATGKATDMTTFASMPYVKEVWSIRFDSGECAPSFFGGVCQPCSVSCGGNGVCNDGLEGDGECVCDANYRGPQCIEIPPSPVVDRVSLSSNFSALAVYWTPVDAKYNVKYHMIYLLSAPELIEGNLIANVTYSLDRPSYFFENLQVGTIIYVVVQSADTLGPNGRDDIAKVVPMGDTPDPVTDLNVLMSPGLDEADLSFQSPQYTGYLPIIGYRIDAESDENVNSFECEASPCTIKNLEAGSSYVFRVSAENAAGVGDAVATQSTTLALSPLPPSDVAVSKSDDGKALTISWGDVVGRGSPVKKLYINVESSVEAFRDTIVLKYDSEMTSYVFTALVKGFSYRFSMQAENNIGISAKSASTPAIIYDGNVSDSKMTIQSTVVSPTSMLITWTNLDFASEYEVQIDGQSSFQRQSPLFRSITAQKSPYQQQSILMDRLSKGEEYFIRMGPVTDDEVAFTTYPFATKLESVPRRPSSFNYVNADAGEVRLSWTVDERDTIDSFTISYGLQGHASKQSVQVSGAQTQLLLIGLNEDTVYTATIVAQNNKGQSQATSLTFTLASSLSSLLSVSANFVDFGRRPTGRETREEFTVTYNNAAYFELAQPRLIGAGCDALQVIAGQPGASAIAMPQGSSLTLSLSILSTVEKKHTCTLLLSSLSLPRSDIMVPIEATTYEHNAEDATDCESDSYTEKDDLVVVEFENTGFLGEWKFYDDAPGYTGSGFIEYSRSNPFPGVLQPAEDIFTVTVKLFTPGIWRILIRGSTPNKTEHNDVFVRFPDTGALLPRRGNESDVETVDSTTWIKSFNNGDPGVNVWNWQTTAGHGMRREIEFEAATPGEYRVMFAARSSLYKMDRLVLYRPADTELSAATDLSQAEAPRCVQPLPPLPPPSAIAESTDDCEALLELQSDAVAPMATMGKVTTWTAVPTTTFEVVLSMPDGFALTKSSVLGGDVLAVLRLQSGFYVIPSRRLVSSSSEDPEFVQEVTLEVIMDTPSEVGEYEVLLLGNTVQSSTGKFAPSQVVGTLSVFPGTAEPGYKFINSGLNSAAGGLWSADTFFTSGKTFEYPETTSFSDVDFPLSKDVLLYERTDVEFGYAINISESGWYDVTVYTAESYFRNAGERVFDIMVQDVVIASNVDVYAKAGRNRPTSFSTTTYVEETLSLLFSASVNQAKISAIQFQPSSVPLTMSATQSVQVTMSEVLFGVRLPDTDIVPEERCFYVSGPAGFYQVPLLMKSAADGSALEVTLKIESPAERWRYLNAGDYVVHTRHACIRHGNGRLNKGGSAGQFAIEVNSKELTCIERGTTASSSERSATRHEMMLSPAFSAGSSFALESNSNAKLVTASISDGVLTAFVNVNQRGLARLVVSGTPNGGPVETRTIIINVQGDWTSLPAKLPAPLGEVAIGVIGRYAYVVGEGQTDATSAVTYKFDLKRKIWVNPVSPRPYPGNHQASIVYEGRWYLFGGLDFDAEGRVQIYTPSSNKWVLGPRSPILSGSASAALIGDKVYYCGGIVGPNQFSVSDCAVYDMITNKWLQKTITSMPYPTNHGAFATDGSKMYVFGGRAGKNSVQEGNDNVMVFDPETNTWTSNLSKDYGFWLDDMPEPRGGMGNAVFWNDEFYIFGGETLPSGIFDPEKQKVDPDTRVFSRVDVFNPNTGTWREEMDMTVPKHGIYPIVYQNSVFIIGGGVRAGYSFSDTIEVL